MAGLIFALIWVLAVAFVWAPLGLFLWFGLPADILTFRSPHVFTSVSILVVWYLALLLIFVRRSTYRRPLVMWGSVFAFWMLGVVGFLRGMNEIAGRFPNIK